VAEAIAQIYGPNALRLDAAEKAAFAGNCICVSDEDVFMSAAGVAALRPENRQHLQAAGFRLHGVDLSEIEKAGGSLRCCVAEIW
jgi:N-dimethylarginine dimethylaminohydrolase